jgi:hypothetical protein
MNQQLFHGQRRNVYAISGGSIPAGEQKDRVGPTADDPEKGEITYFVCLCFAG